MTVNCFFTLGRQRRECFVRKFVGIKISELENKEIAVT